MVLAWQRPTLAPIQCGTSEYLEAIKHAMKCMKEFALRKRIHENPYIRGLHTFHAKHRHHDDHDTMEECGCAAGDSDNDDRDDVDDGRALVNDEMEAILFDIVQPLILFNSKLALSNVSRCTPFYVKI